MVSMWAKLPSKMRTFRKAKELSKTIGFRSIGEVAFAADLEEQGTLYTYEPDVFMYTLPERKYIPDFRLKKKKGGWMYIEYKGRFSAQDRTKIRLIKKQNPDIDLRIVFEKPNNKLNKSSKTTYGAWADQHGIPWSNRTIPAEWRKECGNNGS
jgi:predicted nuclease of restriction endonuclease-like RecB superfamily